MSTPRNPTEAHRNFFQEVHEVVRLVPAGRVTTYGAIAHYLGARHGARMVGWAMMAAPHRRGLGARTTASSTAWVCSAAATTSAHPPPCRRPSKPKAYG